MGWAANPSRALSLLLQACDRHGNSDWRAVRRERSQPKPGRLPSDQQLMRRICVAIAYSQGARSSLVGELIQTREFRAAFCEFNPRRIVTRGPQAILKAHWPRLTCLRFRGKVRSIVKAAEVLLGITATRGSFSRYLAGFQIPRRLHSRADIEVFWHGFEALRRDLRRRGMPFFRSTTSLLQLLLDLDYDSVKPDLIVMRLARRLGLVRRETGDPAFRSAVRQLQEYAVAHRQRAILLDACMLSFGGQDQAKRWLNQEFCPSTDPCANLSCPLGQNGLCHAHRPVRRKGSRNS